MASASPIAFTDKLMVVPNIVQTIGAALFRLATYPFTGGAKASTLFKDVAFAALRKNLSVTSVATEQWMNPSTESGYLDLAKKKGFQPDTEVLNNGLRLYWIGNRSAEKIFLYCHGGGYVLSSSPGHFVWLFDLQNELAKSHSFSVVVIGYTLAPHGQYPLQLRQAAESLEWLLESEKKKPSEIILGGDSAGGNMALSLLSHLLHPHPEVTTKIQLGEPLAGVVLISPWVKFGHDDDSVKRNETSDMVTPVAAARWSSLFLGSRPVDKYNQPILADLAWFNGLDLQVKDILIWGGGGEILIDSIEAVAKVLKDAHSKTELVVQPGAAHEDFIMERLLGYEEKSEGTKLIESWIAERI